MTELLTFIGLVCNPSCGLFYADNTLTLTHYKDIPDQTVQIKERDGSNTSVALFSMGTTSELRADMEAF